MWAEDKKLKVNFEWPYIITSWVKLYSSEIRNRVLCYQTSHIPPISLHDYYHDKQQVNISASVVIQYNEIEIL